ncbi:VOC family protein [Aureibaculum sp. 2210JD6-5]|uniref:VOC family protein n=1 Tax=Aureibaculum sp. 2210JD6-5 TaxID=3103957 RepID=UPI002AACB584|nr:VOC family protein [Aureibaculum sp. 2210JD6-5]MDY7395274.1 VOC family protein [Aureibaculum sp. 2210JD6-5]
MKIDHVTIRTGNLAKTKAFFETVFGLVEKPRPKIIQRIPGHWLYNGKKPFVHLIGGYGNKTGFTTNAIDHVGFQLKDYKKFKQKLKKLKIQYSLMDIEELQERRIFFKTPDGVLLETVFNEKIQ